MAERIRSGLASYCGWGGGARDNGIMEGFGAARSAGRCKRDGMAAVEAEGGRVRLIPVVVAVAVAFMRVMDGEAVADLGNRVAGESNFRPKDLAGELGPAKFRGVAMDAGRAGLAGVVDPPSLSAVA